MLKLFIALTLFDTSALALTIIPSARPSTSARASGARVNAAISAYESFVVSPGHDQAAAEAVSELAQLSALANEYQALHGDSAKGAAILQTRIKKAIKKISLARGRALDHDGYEIDSIAAETYRGIW